MSKKELSNNDKLAVFIIKSSNDPSVIQEVLTDPCYANLQPHIIEHVSVEQSSQESDAKKSSPDSVGNIEIPLDAKPSKDEAKKMNTITRDEFDSKLSAVEARMDLRVEKFSSDMKEVIAELRIERADRDEKVNTAISGVTGKLEPLKDLKVHMWAGVVGVAAVIIAAVALSTSSFDSGRNTAKETQDVRQEFLQQKAETDQSLKEISQSLKILTNALQKNGTDSN